MGVVLGGKTTVEVTVPEAVVVPATAFVVATVVAVVVVTMVLCLLGVDTVVAMTFCSWPGAVVGPEVEDTAEEGVLFVIAVCPATDAATAVTVLVVDTTVVVTAGLLIVAEIWVDCTTFCGEAEEDTGCDVFAFTGDAPAS